MLELEDTTARTREIMLEIAQQDGFAPANLTPKGLVRYHEVLAKHILEGDVSSFYSEIRTFGGDCLQGDRRGIIPVDWAQRLAVTDWLSLWNCARARELLEQGETHAIIVRAASAYEPRGQCLRLEGFGVPLTLVADGFRAKYYPVANRDAFSLPIGPNCHHGIRHLTASEKARSYTEQVIDDVTYRAYDA